MVALFDCAVSNMETIGRLWPNREVLGVPLSVQQQTLNDAGR